MKNNTLNLRHAQIFSSEKCEKKARLKFGLVRLYCGSFRPTSDSKGCASPLVTNVYISLVRNHRFNLLKPNGYVMNHQFRLRFSL